MNTMPNGRRPDACSRLSRPLRHLGLTCLLLLALTLLPLPAQAGGVLSACGLQAVAPTSAEGAPGDVATFQFTVIDDGSGTCGGTLTGSIFVATDTGDSSASIPAASSTWTAALPATVTFTVNLGPMEGDATIQVVCSGCSTVLPPAQFSTSTRIAPPDYVLTQVSPPDGTVGFAGDVIPLVLRLDEGGAPAPDTTVEWHIVGNPNGSVFGQPAAGTTLANLTSSAGQATIELVVGQPNAVPADIEVSATVFSGVAGAERTVSYIIAARDLLELEATNPASDNQEVRLGQPLAVPFDVRVLRNGAADTLGRSILWSVNPAGAAVLSATDTPTDSAGRASITATAGSVPGPFTITATHADDPGETVTFNALAKQYGIAKPVSGSGDGQAGAPGTALPDPLRAIVSMNGSPIDDVSVQWSVQTGTATLTGPNPGLSAGDGSVAMPVTLGATEGTVQIRVELTDDPTVFTDFTATIGVVRDIDKPAGESGDAQSGPVGTPLPLPLRALATNDGVPAAGVSVHWEVITGAASFGQNPTLTDADGIAGVSVTLGATAGAVVVSATRADDPVAKTSFTLQATAGTVLSLVKPPADSGDGQRGFTGDTLPQPLVVVAQNDGVPTAGVTVDWSVNTGSAALGAEQSVTDANGRASIPVTLGATPGSISITASRADAPLATSSFVLTAREPVAPVFRLEKPDDSGDGSTASPGESLELVARVLRNGIGVAFERVGWEVLSGDAETRPSLGTSQTGGLARTRLELGDTPGAIVVRAWLIDYPDVSILYNINSTTGTGDTLAIVSGDAQSAPPGTALAPLVVRYSNASGPITDAPVLWELLEGSATLGETATSTDADGRSRIDVSLGATPGPVHVRATAGSSSVVFDLTVTGDGLRLQIIGGDGQTGPIGSVADLPLLVEVRDSTGNPRAGQVLEWEISFGSATLDQTRTTTDSDGRSSVVLTYDTTPGPVAVLAYFPGRRNDAVAFSLGAVLPLLHAVSGDGQSGSPGEALAQDFVVELVHPAGPAKALAGVTVNWQVLEGGGSLDTIQTVTDADGRTHARLTLGPAVGPNRVGASVIGGDPVLFTAMTIAAEDHTLEIVSGNAQALPTRAASAPLVVLVRDAAGQPVAGAQVHWSADNAELQGSSTTSGADGRASNIAQIVLPGAATITASLDRGDAAASFVINGGVANIGGLDPTQENIARAIDTFCPELVASANLSPAQLDLRTRCLELVDNAGSHPEDVRNALDALRQDVAMGQSNAAYAAVGAQFDNLKTRIAALRAGSSGMDLGGLAVATGSGVLPLSLLPADPADNRGGSTEDVGADFSRWGFFASGQIGRGSQDGDSATPEYDFDSTGLTAGVDYRFSDQLIFGVSAGWNRQETELVHGRGSIDTRGWSLSAYSTWYRDNAWYLDGVLSVGSNDYDLDRRIRYAIPGADGSITQIDQLAVASSGGDQRSLAVSFGRDFQKGAWSLGPYLRGTYTRIDFDAYSERTDANLPGAGLGLAVDARELESQTAVLGGKASYAMSRDWGILMPHVQIEWEHEFQDDPDNLVARFLHDPTHTAIRTDGEALDTDYYNLGLGLSALFPGGKSAFFYYERLVGASGQSQDNLSLGVRIEF